MEAISAFDWKRIDRNRLKGELDLQLSQLQRSVDVQTAQRLATELTQADLTNARLLSELFQRLDDYLVRIAKRAQLIPISAEIIQHQVQLSRETELDRDDALILASCTCAFKGQHTDQERLFDAELQRLREGTSQRATGRSWN
jgi:hypothetical protein